MWLNRCGIAFERAQTIGPRPFNKKGQFEDTSVVALHNAVINKYAPRTKGWIVTKDVAFEFCPEQRDVALRIIRSYEGTYDVWGWKDPRMALFLKAWKELIPELKVILVWRSAGEAIRSLMNRARGTAYPSVRLSLWEAIRCWMIYNRKILEFREIFPRDTLLFPLHCLIRKDQEAIGLINAKFDVRLKNVSITEVYEKQLLNAKESRCFYLYPGIKKLTRRLEESSVIFPKKESVNRDC
jgi:hypothetical protein